MAANKGKVVGGSIAAVLAMAAAPVMYFEGLIPNTYADPAGIPTICYGHTGPDVTPGRVATVQECVMLLDRDLQKHWRGIEKCIQRPIRVNQAAALTSFAFNVGVGAACNSTLMRKLNAGAPANEWCAELSRWTKATIAGVRVELRGLVKRRAAERALCERT